MAERSNSVVDCLPGTPEAWVLTPVHHRERERDRDDLPEEETLLVTHTTEKHEGRGQA